MFSRFWYDLFGRQIGGEGKSDSSSACSRQELVKRVFVALLTLKCGKMRAFEKNLCFAKSLSRKRKFILHFVRKWCYFYTAYYISQCNIYNAIICLAKKTGYISGALPDFSVLYQDGNKRKIKQIIPIDNSIKSGYT